MLGDSDGVDVGFPVLVGPALGWLDGIPLTLGLSDGVDVGLPVLVGLILGCELGEVETLGFADGMDDGEAEIDGDSEGNDVGHCDADGTIDGAEDGSVDNDGCAEIEGDSDGRLVLKIIHKAENSVRIELTKRAGSNAKQSNGFRFTYGHWDADGFIEGELLGSVEVDGLPLG